jgi:hypothetical protein
MEEIMIFFGESMIRLYFTVDIPAIFDAQDDDGDSILFDGVEDDVVFAGMDAADAGVTDELAGTGAAWVFS